ncbi:MAG TPA: hypothetical protein VJ063_19170 [Verrucomicrobiae bacterium]|nr:hypothetical protein [Verrucomicrobiae bacterium]
METRTLTNAAVPALILTTTCLGMAGLPGDWQIRETPVATHLTAVASAPGQLIAVGHAATILASGNGSAWDVVPYTGSGDFHCVTFAKGLYVAGGTLDCLLASSSDGVNWTTTQTTTGQHGHFGVTYGGGRFVTVGRGGLFVPTRILNSTNGIDWQPADVPPTTNILRAVTFGNGKYVAVGDNGTILTSADATTWTSQISGTDYLLRSVMFTGREFLAGGDSSTLLTSDDGISWVSVPHSSFDVRGLATCGTAVVKAGGQPSEGWVEASTNGLSWSGYSEVFPSRLNAVIHFALGKFFAVGNNALIVESGAVANAPVNVWTSSTNGYWHEGPWSLGHVPSWADQSIVLPNGAGRTLEINSATTRDYPDSLRIRELLVGAFLRLFLNNAGWSVPLKMDQPLRLPRTVSLLSINSAIEGTEIDIGGQAIFADTHALFTGKVGVGFFDEATVIQSNGNFAAASMRIDSGSWTQCGGTNELLSMSVTRGCAYSLFGLSPHSPSPRNGTLSAGTIEIIGELRLTGGVVSNTLMYFDTGALKARGTYDLGRLEVNFGVLDFQNAGTVLHFQDSHAVSWSSPSLVVVTNWTSGSDQLFIGHNQAGLTAAQLSRIRFANPGGFSPGLYSARILSTGEVVPVPRLVSYQRSANGLVLNWPQGYRLLTATNVAGPYSLITNAISPYTASYHTDPQRFFIIGNEN